MVRGMYMNMDMDMVVNMDINPLRPIPPFSDDSFVASLGTMFIEGFEIFSYERGHSVLRAYPRDGRAIGLPFLL
jgi:hypothetical protein